MVTEANRKNSVYNIFPNFLSPLFLGTFMWFAVRLHVPNCNSSLFPNKLIMLEKYLVVCLRSTPYIFTGFINFLVIFLIHIVYHHLIPFYVVLDQCLFTNAFENILAFSYSHKLLIEAVHYFKLGIDSSSKQLSHICNIC